MNLPIAKKLESIKPSATLALTSKVKELKQQGEDIVSFGAGEPDFDTPIHIKNAAKQSIDAGKTKYTASNGTLELRTAITKKFKDDNQLDFSPNQVTVGSGGKKVLSNFLMATLNPGDEVIIPAPYWVSYPDMVLLADGVPVIAYTGLENNFKLTPEILKKHITKKTKVCILNSPSNPTGSLYSRKDMESILEIILSNNIFVLSDDLYEKILYDNHNFCNFAMLSKEAKERTFIVNGVSKAYSMTGWRIGYGAGNETIIKNMNIIQSQTTSNPSSISQEAALEAISGDQACVLEMNKSFLNRRNLIVDSLNKIDGITCLEPEGAFYVFPYINKTYQFPKFEDLYNKSKQESKSQFFCELLLEKFKMAIVPGIAFGDDNALRFSYATSEAEIKKGLSRLKEFIDFLKS